MTAKARPSARFAARSRCDHSTYRAAARSNQDENDAPNAMVHRHGRCSRLGDDHAHRSRGAQDPGAFGQIQESCLAAGFIEGCRAGRYRAAGPLSFPSCRRERRDRTQPLPSQPATGGGLQGRHRDSGRCCRRPKRSRSAAGERQSASCFRTGRSGPRRCASAAEVDDVGAAVYDFGAASRGPACFRTGRSGQDCASPADADDAGAAVMISALPPEDQPEAGQAKTLPPHPPDHRSITRPRSLPARSSSIHRNTYLYRCSATARPSATASAWAAKASPGPAPRR